MIAQFLLVPVTCKSFPSSTTDWEKAPLGEGEGAPEEKGNIEHNKRPHYPQR